MIEFTSKYQKIVNIFIEKGKMQSSLLRAELTKHGENVSLITVKRILSEMTNSGILTLQGSGRSTSYEISPRGRIFADINAHDYCLIDPDKRYGLNNYNFELLTKVPSDIFTSDELNQLNSTTYEYKNRTQNLPPVIQKKELERLVIELSWKSSKIEGNTYTLLDTEKLILENKEAPGHSKEETQMILNHKDAFNYIHQNSSQFKTLTQKNLNDIHSILIKKLNVNSGLRTKPVGITGSIYRPLDNIYQITEAVKNLEAAVSQIETPYAKALIALLGISYIQPFEDGNKRTSRLMANGLLMAQSLAPLSYRSVDENEYRSAMLVFYELNSIMPFKKIFIDQYIFAAQNYTIK